MSSTKRVADEARTERWIGNNFVVRREEWSGASGAGTKIIVQVGRQQFDVSTEDEKPVDLRELAAAILEAVDFPAGESTLREPGEVG